jgi:transcriptional regulator with XRE-family HTH domain
MRLICGSTDTANGARCGRFARHESGRCAWHDEINIQRRRLGKPLPPTKVCGRCKRELPRRMFRPTGRQCPASGERYGASICRGCEEQERRAAGVPKRHPRYNARGEVWCNRCERYQHADNYRPHPNRPGTLWSYCKACTIQIDRERYHRKKRTPAGWEQQDRSIARKRERRAANRRDRRKFVKESMELLRRRGFTISEISRLTGISLTTIYQWPKGATPSPPAANRIQVVVLETGHLKAGAVPEFRRRRPHPELEQLMSRIAPQLERFVTRSRWRTPRHNAQV